MAPSTLTPGTAGISGALAIWLSNGFVISLILARLVLRRWRHDSSRNAFTAGDGWLVVALVFHELRVAGDCYMNKYGTPLSVSMNYVIIPWVAGIASEVPLTEAELGGLVLAGKLMIVTRIAVVVVLWSLKISVLDYLGSLLETIRCKQTGIRIMYVILAMTFSASILSVFLECRPFELNWTLFPDVAKCSFDTQWLVIYEICNIITDTMLLFLPILLILGSPISEWEQPQRPVARLFGIWVFGLGATLVAIEIVRLVQGLLYTNTLLNRIVWGSIEVALATAVTTLPTIYILLREGSQEQLERSKKSSHTGTGTISASPKASDEGRHGESCASEQTATLNDNSLPRHNAREDKTLISTEMGQEEDTRRRATWNQARSSVIGSILDSMLSEAKKRDSWSRPGSVIRNSLRGADASSRDSMRMQVADDNLQDILMEWIELEETESGSVHPSEVPDNAEYKGVEIMVAREISQEARREPELGQRPRLITIPGRSKLACPAR
ncbi:hypothetical protein F5B22DRAFT_648072 [Xylaria bambusicola]|uniref:uncharacterized protein n=1 Tax=Xylaria bambusicola TaxID=326684 RepID=UPI0020081029|nr:uncharacterized protein F5B22DRAFT_648072 [Xylaria bambusicola]KAI0512977.1 hypothetical protein F5B22DRAFT_648072 [Xylaria bambusicola]